MLQYPIMAQLKRIAKLLLETTNDSFMANGSQGSLLSRLTVAALRLNNHAIATDAISHRQNQFRNDMNPLESCAIVRTLLRAGNVVALVRVVVLVAVALAHDDTSKWDRMTRVGWNHARETTRTCGRTIGSNTVGIVLVAVVAANDGGATNRQPPWPRPLRIFHFFGSF